ncbi:MAG: hypothetical protein KAR54_01565 [Candidatus Pacebacteria bacterium]|nr:hypothetical protein [Candidatus Paceibacterota bacterium]
MKKLLIIFFLFLPSVIFAEEDFEWLPSIKTTGGLISGYITGFILHETGHQLEASRTNTDISWKMDGVKLTWHTKKNKEDVSRSFYLAGLTTDIVGGTILTYTLTEPTKNPFLLGLIIFQITNPIFYVLSHEFMRPEPYETGDICGYESTGANPKPLEAFLLLSSLASLYRIMAPSTEVYPLITMNKNLLVIGITKRF